MMNRREYRKELDRLKRLAPDHVLMPTLKLGFDVINAVYLQHALKQVEKGPETVVEKKEHVVRIVDSTREKAADIAETTDPVLRDLWATRGRLFRLSSKTSNKFHVCKTDEERKAVSQELLGIWEQIQDVKHSISHYETHGQLIEKDERFPLPDDPIALVKKRNAIRQAISEQRGKIERLAQLEDSPEKAHQIQQAETKLNELILYRGHADQKIQRSETGVLD
jgi:hypothetical protein